MFYLCLREKESEREWARGRKRGRHGIRSRLWALSCQHRPGRGARTHELWDHDRSRSWTLNGLGHPGAPDSPHVKGADSNLYQFLAFSFPSHRKKWHKKIFSPMFINTSSYTAITISLHFLYFPLLDLLVLLLFLEHMGKFKTKVK